ncbi:MAG: flagellar biosynthesis protein FlhF [Burkholderiaceae bacterium]
MNAKQFTAPTARQALLLARKALGPDAVILSNRKTADGICVTAMLESDLIALDAQPTPVQASASSLSNTPEALAGAPVDPAPVQPAPASGSPEPMSTVKFQRFAEERKARRDSDVRSDASKTPPGDPDTRLTDSAAIPTFETPVTPASSRTDTAWADRPVPESRRDSQAAAAELSAMAGELRQMRSFISQQFSALSWVDGVRRTPGQAQVLRRLLQAGFSGQLARSLVGHLPENCDGPQADQWLAQALIRNLEAPGWSERVVLDGGVFALVGPTGVGKTTSVAKIAARCALEHGVDQVGLITADAYRVGAQDQLRRFGSMIGITVHTAHDSESLHSLLGLLQTKRVVLIDTAGLGQRDSRVSQLLEAVSQGPIQRLLVLSAAAQTEAMRESIEAYQGNDCVGVLLTKLDEACRLGGALDTLIRFRLPLLAVGDGQRVPEDWHPADVAALVNRALSAADIDEPGLPDIDLTMLMQRVESGGGGSGAPLTARPQPVAGAY